MYRRPSLSIDSRLPRITGGRFAVLALLAIFTSAHVCRADDSQKGSSPRAEKAADLSPVAPEPIAEPSAELSPEDVVQKQMHALSGSGPVLSRIDRCYRFASPANRSHTGPLERFATMVQSPDYQAVLNAKHFLVGHATQQNNEAHVLVTTVDPAGELTLFRFFLSKQTKAPHAGCWMTDAVIRVGTLKPVEEAKKRPGESPTI